MTLRSLISAAKWDRSIRARPLNWWDSDLLRHYLNERICGLPGLEDGSHAVLRDKLEGRSLKRGLSIGCGNAGKEMRLLESGIVRAFDLYDISAAVTASGRAYALSHGLNAIYLSHSPLDAEPEPIYDFIYWDHALHHMSDVRAVLQWCKGSLAQDGVICINDYVGPPRLQWTKHEVEAVNSLLRDMEMKYDIAIPKAVAGTLAKRLKQMLKDPSEAPQSHLIEQAVSDAFSNFRLRPLGGAMLNICGGLVMNLPNIPAGLLEDFKSADEECLRMGIYHFAFGLFPAGSGR